MSEDRLIIVSSVLYINLCTTHTLEECEELASILIEEVDLLFSDPPEEKEWTG